jgi:hypothetical protein
VEVEVWVWAVLKVAVGLAAIEAVGLSMLVVGARRVEGKYLLHAWGLVKGQDYISLWEAANTVALQRFQL